MSTDQKVFTSRDGAVFIQRAPNVEPEYLGCYDIGDVNPSEGDVELIQGRDVWGKYRVMAHTESAPEVIEIELTAWLDKVAHYLERVACPFYLHVNKRCGGIANAINNYERGISLEIIKRTARNLTALAAGIGEDADSQQVFTLAGAPPLWDVYKLTPDRQTTAEAQAANDTVFVRENLCGDCTPRYEEGTIGMNVHDAAGGATANVQYTLTGGSTWTTCAADPFAADENITTVAYAWIDSKRIRFFVGRGTTDAGNPAEIAYTDFNVETDTAIGAAWTLANVGSTNGQFFFGPKSIFAYDYFNIWAVAGAGYIYKSSNGGQTWTAQESGVLTTEDFYTITAAPDSKRFLVAAGENNAIAKTKDGGVTWSSVTGPSTQTTDEILTLDIITEKFWVIGYNDGLLFATYNGGVTWSGLTGFTGTGVGMVRAVKFLNPVQGYMLTNNASPVGAMHVTRDCGITWEALTTPTNAGLNSLAVIRADTVYAVGEPQASTAMILKTSGT